jgi:cytochrome c biogenesis protein CcmG/thiol:disulfide interchange protein DsbE
MTTRRPGFSLDFLPRSPRLPWIVLGIVLVLGAGLELSGVLRIRPPRTSHTIDFTLNNLAGKPVHLSDYRGRPVLVNLWASWCATCRAEIPDLMQFYREHQAQDMVFLAVDTQDDINAARQFVNDLGMFMPVLYDPQGKVMHRFGFEGLPSSFLVDRKGNLVFAQNGQLSSLVLASEIAPLLAQ